MKDFDWDLIWRITAVLIGCGFLGILWFLGYKEAATIGTPTPKTPKNIILLFLLGISIFALAIFIAYFFVKLRYPQMF